MIRGTILLSKSLYFLKSKNPVKGRIKITKVINTDAITNLVPPINTPLHILIANQWVAVYIDSKIRVVKLPAIKLNL
jgi:hypothetical protein